MAAPTYNLAIDLDRDELFASGEAKTADVVSEGGAAGEVLIQYQRGHDIARVLSQPMAGAGSFLLNNKDGTYSIGTSIAAGQAVRLQAAYAGTTYDLIRAMLDQPIQSPIGTGRTFVRCPLLGPLSRLAGQKVSTALYASITTGVAIGHLLDAAGYAKNAQAYITSLTPAGQWGLGGAAGTETDLSGNGNAATVTYAAGQRGAAALDDGGDGATTFVPGITNAALNPVFGHATPGNGYTLVRETAAAGTANDHPLASFGVTTTEYGTSTANFAYHELALTGLTLGHVMMGVVIWRAKQGAGGVPDPVVNVADSAVASNFVHGTAFGTADTAWRICAQRFTVTATGRTMVAAYSSWGDGAGIVDEIAYIGAIDLTAAGLTGLADLSFATFDLATHGIYVAAGNMGTGYSWSGTAHASTSTRVATKSVTTDVAAIQNLFDGGGGIAVLCNLTSDGQSDTGRLIDKAAWYLNVQNESGGNVRLNFRVGFSGTEGIWQSAVSIPLSTALVIVVAYNADATTNDPTIYVINLSTGAVSTLTVGSGLTETSTPVGTRTTDVGSDLIGGNNAAGTRTAAGVIDEPSVFTTIPTAVQAKAWAARAMNAPRHLDAGQTTLEFWWLDDEDAMGALTALKATEGPGAALYEDGTGAVTFKSRHARLLDSRSTAIQTTLRTAAGATEPLASLPFAYDPGTRDVVNQVTTTVKRRALATADYLWQTQEPYATITPGETKKITTRLSDPGSGFVTGLLTTNPTYASTLAAAIADTTTLTFTIPTGEAPTIETNAIIDIEGEYMKVASRATGSPNDTVTVYARGAWGTTAATHLISTAVRTRAFVANANSGFTGTNLTGNITVTLDRTSGQTATFTFVNGGTATAYLFARLYGQSAAVQETYDVASTIDASASIAAYGLRTYPLPLRAEIPVATAQDLANAIVSYQQDGRATATVTVKGIQGAARLTAALAREVSDRVRIIHAGSGLDAEFYVENITHRVIAPASHVTTFAVEEAPTDTYAVWGTSLWGTGRWGF